jgi:hypothetical protein
MGGGWKGASVRGDVMCLHGSAHLEAAFDWLKRFPIACP